MFPLANKTNTNMSASNIPKTPSIPQISVKFAPVKQQQPVLRPIRSQVVKRLFDETTDKDSDFIDNNDDEDQSQQDVADQPKKVRKSRYQTFATSSKPATTTATTAKTATTATTAKTFSFGAAVAAVKSAKAVAETPVEPVVPFSFGPCFGTSNIKSKLPIPRLPKNTNTSNHSTNASNTSTNVSNANTTNVVKCSVCNSNNGKLFTISQGPGLFKSYTKQCLGCAIKLLIDGNVSIHIN